MNMSVITLIIKQKYFNAIKNGSKTKEYRIVNKYYETRIENKQIDFIKFKNGYSRDAPQLIIECLKITKEKTRIDLYGKRKQEFYVFHLGQILTGKTPELIDE